MTASTSDAATRLDRYLDARTLTHATVAPLTGDASDRRYFRITVPDQASQIAAVHVGPIDFATLPFAIVAALLTAMPVRVPRILGHDNALGVIALEDLGDVTLQAHMATATTDERRARYAEAIGIIDTLQRRGHELYSPALLPYQLAFDLDKLTWELRFFTTHFLEGHRAAMLASSERSALDAEYHAIGSELAGEPRVLCHRDYHSRNLMLHLGHLYVIDFQDARLGPDTYDLVSLLRDAYVDFDAEDVDAHIAGFLAARRADAGYRADFRRRFDLMAVQRTMKALGTFGFQATSRNNPSYLQNVPRTLAVLRQTLVAHSRFAPLRRLLAAHIPELG